MSGGHRQQCAGPLAKPSRTVPGAHSVQLASKPPSAPVLHWHLACDHILGIYGHSATQKEHCCSSSQPQVSTAYSLLVLYNYSVFVLFALVQAAPHSHACPERACAQGCAELVACVRIPRTRCTLLVDCLDLGHESRAALSGQPMHGRRCPLAAQPRVCRAVRLHNTATSPNLMLDPVYQYMRPFELARTVNIRSSFGDSTTARYIDLPYAASLWVLGRNIASPAEPCSIVWVVMQMTAVFHHVGRRANDRSSTGALSETL